MNRTALTAEIAGATAVQLALAALLAHATERATLLETEEAQLGLAHLVPGPRIVGEMTAQNASDQTR